MDKITYLAELAEGLARWVPERERQDILRYYAEYFDEAGPGREAEVVAELGDPWALSCRLAVEGGYVTYEKAASWTPRKRWPKVLIGVAAGLSVFALIFGFGLLAFNVMRNVTGIVRNPVMAIATDAPGAFGQVLLEGDNIVFAEVIDSALIDGESVVAFRTIDADISLGNIQVLDGDDYTLSITRSEALLGYEPVLEISNGVLRLRDGDLSRQIGVNSWDDLKKLFGVDQLSLEVTITVPGGAALDKVGIKTGLGDVMLYGVSAETVAAETGLGDVMLYGVSAETVTAETGLGNVECYEARDVKRLELNTGLGDVGLRLEEVCGSMDIELESGMGNVEVNLAFPESDCAYELESGMGVVTVNGGLMGSKAVHRGGLPYKLDAESGMGNVNVYFN